jgi:hypothetical protein
MINGLAEWRLCIEEHTAAALRWQLWSKGIKQRKIKKIKITWIDICAVFRSPVEFS